MIKTSIVGAAIARDLQLRLDGGDRVARVTSGDIHATARRTRHGSLFVAVHSSRQFGHVSPCTFSVKSYVRAGTKAPGESINRLVTSLLQQAHDPIHSAREALYKLSESRVIPDDFATNAPLPNEQVYDRMTQADIDAWTPVIQALPLKA